MLVWWFGEGVMGTSVQPASVGRVHLADSHSRFPNYLVWHPRDHASFTLLRRAPGALPAGVGATVRVVEALVAREPYLLPADRAQARRLASDAIGDVFVDSRSMVTRLDGGGTEMEQRLPLTGRAMMQLAHAWADGPGGAALRSVLQLGAAAGALHMPPLRAVLDLDKLGRSWVRHCVEEFGNLENFLPGLFHAAHSVPD